MDLQARFRAPAGSAWFATMSPDAVQRSARRLVPGFRASASMNVMRECTVPRERAHTVHSPPYGSAARELSRHPFPVALAVPFIGMRGDHDDGRIVPLS